MARWFGIIRVVLGALCMSVSVVTTPVLAQSSQTVTYVPSLEDFPNPERGFYSQDAPLWLDDVRLPQTVEALQALRDQAITMMRWYFLIDEYRQQDLDADVLAFIDEQFDNARTAGIKVIPRFAYNFPTSGEYPYTEPDASLARTLRHLDQLAPILQQNSDVIAFVEAGLIGAWGEWHSSTHGHVHEEYGVMAGARAILGAWLNILPKSRMVALRYPPYKQQFFGENPLDPTTGFGTSAKARVGAHNDCFLASNTDWGTFPEDPDLNQMQREYLHLDNRYVPQGGETCNAGEDAQPYIGCANALDQLLYMRYSALNIDYHPDVLDLWREQGCFEIIAQHLGYRFTLHQATIPNAASSGQPMNLSLMLANTGFASPYNPRDVRVILRSQANGTVWSLTPNTPVDPRRWLRDNGTFTLPLDVTLPSGMPSGTYEVLLHLPDPMPSLAPRPEYAIRLANENTWEEAAGYNRLLAVVVVNSAVR